MPVHGLIDVVKESNLLFPYSTTLSYWFCALMVAKGLPVLLQCSPLQEMTVVTIFSSLLSGKERKKEKSPGFPLQTFPHISPFRYCQRPSELQRAAVTANGANPSLCNRRQGGRRELPDWHQLPSHACSRARRHCQQVPYQLLQLEDLLEIFVPSLWRKVGLCDFIFRFHLINNLLICHDCAFRLQDQCSNVLVNYVFITGAKQKERLDA